MASGSTRTMVTPTIGSMPTIVWCSRSLRNSLHFSSDVSSEEFCFSGIGFVKDPCQPPSIFPISASGSERATYELCFNESVSKRINKKNLIASHLRIATFTYGIFSSGFKNVAVKIISIVSTNKSSMRLPREYR